MRQIQAVNRTVKFSLIFVITGFLLVLFGGRAHAATLTVSNDCPLSDAILSVNNAGDQNTCASSGVYGTDDTITIPAGTVTLDDHLPAIETSGELTIQGAGKTETAIEQGQWKAIWTDNSESANITVKDLAVSGDAAATWGIELLVNQATISSVEVSGSAGIHVFLVQLSASDISVHDCESGENAGFLIEAAAQESSDDVLVSVDRASVRHNTAVDASGLLFSLPEVSAHSRTLHVQRSWVDNNEGAQFAGLVILGETGSAAHIDLQVDATTVSNNQSISTDTTDYDTPFSSLPISAGIYFYINGVTNELNFNNVTVASNSVVNNANNLISVAGFTGAILSSDRVNLTNVTVVSNSATQENSSPGFGNLGSFIIDSVTNFTDINIASGARATNVLIANNTSNGERVSCIDSFDSTALVDELVIDLTPLNGGHNMTDDPQCTGYGYQPNLYSTLGPLQDNGGSVPTIALLEGSPAIGAGGQVLGISTDARGIARPANPDIGAYQSTFAASVSTTSAGNLAKTGLFIGLAGPVGLLLIVTSIYSYLDYRRHKRPLNEAMPGVDYSYFHHLRVVSIPLLRYRLSFIFEKKLSTHSDKIRRI